MGGTSDPAINEPSNLVMLCDACHLRGVEIYRLQAYRDGFLLYANDDPAREPVKIYAAGFVCLTQDGRYTPWPPARD